ncbi:MAG: hypothetical protein V3V97_01740 [Hyphomicrobiaceae bacterium]
MRSEADGRSLAASDQPPTSCRLPYFLEATILLPHDNLGMAMDAEVGPGPTLTLLLTLTIILMLC